MLAKVTVTKWEGLGKDVRVKDTTNGDTILMNGNRINGLQVRSSTKSKFLFVDNHHDFREKPSYVEAEETNANINTYIDYTWNSALVTLNFYTDNDVSLATVATRINCESIAYVYKDELYPATKSWVVYYEGGKRREKICDYSINQVYSLVDDGNLTTS